MYGELALRPLAGLAGRQHGVVGRAQLKALGLTDDQIEWRAKRGDLVRLYRGVYAVGHAALSREGRWMAATLALGAQAVLSHRSAAELWALVPGSSPSIHVTVPGGGSRSRRRGLVVHRSSAESSRRRGIPVTPPPRTLLDLAEVTDRRGLERAVDEGERLRLCSERQLRAVAAAHPGRVGAARLRTLLGYHLPGTTATANDFEELFLALCREHGLPPPECNVPLRRYRPDFLWRDERLIVETDGRATHGTRQAFERDRARDAELTAAGWRVLRFTWRQLTEQPEWVSRKVAGVLNS